jgi:hypothetical protein
VITRLAELGGHVEQGKLSFVPTLIRPSEFLVDEAIFRYRDIAGKPQSISLRPESFGYTICQVPVVCRLSKKESITITYASGRKEDIEGLQLSRETSQHIFNRDGHIHRIDISLEPGIEYSI